jgi:two-component system C4-dicarboxylate transport response regulator DctD
MAPIKSLREVEREAIDRALNRYHGNVSRAAKALNVPRSTLRDRLRRYGIAAPGE